ncbi:uncharacterized protein LOC18995747 isoform X1 [Amborella trichopoda]|uniref:uncharacterized protein LOC18995747 isoform X1 n=1 Tax=Amborella trichopoda TaxID=13333 RepID=UPI0009BE0D05|nr:uncharacterized protein LOC18995747 isoform X1 [Amborella trichopoda]|eukprot:XP_020524285.1 uncharacterized protein LOC18995747 isoform X1 [Amborella trichopoda]
MATHPDDSKALVPFTPWRPPPTPSATGLATCASAQPRARPLKEELWPNTAIDALLDRFEEYCFNRPQAQLGKKHWDRIAMEVNRMCRTEYTGMQCKYKWHRLKKTYAKEKQRAGRSKWAFFPHVELLVNKSSRAHMGEPNGDPDEHTPASPLVPKTEPDGPGFEGGGKRRRGVARVLGQAVEKGIGRVAEVVGDLERKRTDEMRRILDAQLQVVTAMFQGLKEVREGASLAPSLNHAMKDWGLNPPQNDLCMGKLYPPINFGMVDKRVYRSGFPNCRNFAFLETLHLNSIICLCSEPYPEASIEFLSAHGIRLFHIASDFKGPMLLFPDTVREALRVLLDSRNHPILIHCKKGKRQTSCLVGCLRRVQNWCFSSVFEEYERYAGGKNHVNDLQFIEQFDVSNAREYCFSQLPVT